MSDVSRGPGWWLASDGRWYPPELHPAYAAPYAAPSATGPAAGWSSVADRFGRGLRLAAVGFSMVRDEPGLLAVAAVGFVVELLVAGAGAVAGVAGFGALATGQGGGHGIIAAIEWLFAAVAAVAMVLTSVVVQATIVWRVTARFRGDPVSNGQALAAALAASPRLLVWALVKSVMRGLVGTVRSRGVLGAVAGSVAGVAWALVSFFVVPVILFEVLGPVAAIRRSATLCRQRWGENVAGNSAVAVVGVLAVAAVGLVSAVLAVVWVPLGVAFGVAGLALTVIALTVVSASFGAALYWFALTGRPPGPYSADDLRTAYGPAPARLGAFGP